MWREMYNTADKVAKVCRVSKKSANWLLNKDSSVQFRVITMFGGKTEYELYNEYDDQWETVEDGDYIIKSAAGKHYSKSSDWVNDRYAPVRPSQHDTRRKARAIVDHVLNVKQQFTEDLVLDVVAMLEGEDI